MFKFKKSLLLAMLLIFKLAAATPPNPSSFPSLAQARTPQELTARIEEIKDFGAVLDNTKKCYKGKHEKESIK